MFWVMSYKKHIWQLWQLAFVAMHALWLYLNGAISQQTYEPMCFYLCPGIIYSTASVFYITLKFWTSNDAPCSGELGPMKKHDITESQNGFLCWAAFKAKSYCNQIFSLRFWELTVITVLSKCPDKIWLHSGRATLLSWMELLHISTLSVTEWLLCPGTAVIFFSVCSIMLQHSLLWCTGSCID